MVKREIVHIPLHLKETEIPKSQMHVNSLQYFIILFSLYIIVDMLVYIRQSALSELLQEIKEEDIPAHLKIRFEKELEIEENHQKELLESSLFIVIKLATFTDLCNHQSTLFDLMDFQKAKTFKVQKSSTLKAFKVKIIFLFFFTKFLLENYISCIWNSN